MQVIVYQMHRNGVAIARDLLGDEARNIGELRVGVFEDGGRLQGDSGRSSWRWLRTFGCSDNPIRKVWKVDLGTQTVFSYERAFFAYHADADPTFNLELSALTLFMFFFSAFRVTGGI